MNEQAPQSRGRRTLFVSGVTVIIAGVGLAVAFWSGDGSRNGLLRPDDVEIVLRGKQVYAAECASCHGANGEGQPDWDTRSTVSSPLAPPHDGSGHTWQHSDRALFQLTKYGTSEIACRTLNSDAMPEFQELLSDEDVVATLSYIKSRWPDDIRRRHDAVNERYAYSPFTEAATE